MILRGLLLASALAIAGCAHAPSCNPGDDEMTRLQCRAWSGDKWSQLQLGQRFEAGDGVGIDLKQAAKLYRMAAEGTSGTTYVYSPPVGKRGRGMVLPVRTGVDQPGLAEAKYRLGLMYTAGRGVKKDEARGNRLMAEARELGYSSRLPD